MKKAIHLLAPLILLAAGCAGLDQGRLSVTSPYRDYSTLKKGEIVHLATGRALTETELYDFVAPNRIIYIGESHESVTDHEVQLKIIKAMNERFPGKTAVGLEMLRTDSQTGADEWVKGVMGEKEFLKLWIKNWGNSYPYYEAILTYVRENKIPLVAMNRPKPLMASHGAAAKNQPQEKPEPLPEPEIDYDDPYYEAYINAFLAGHESGGPEIKKMFMKGQLLWDETMAQTGAEYLKRPENKDVKLIVLAGGNHVRYGIGVPRRLFRRVPESYAILLPVVIDFPEEKQDKLMEVSLPPMPMPEADLIWAVPYADLDDEIIRLGVGITNAEGGGIEVTEVFPKSSAEKAGVVKGDVIVGIDGTPLMESFDLTYELSKKKKGDAGKLTILRNGEKQSLDVVYQPVKHK